MTDPGLHNRSRCGQRSALRAPIWIHRGIRRAAAKRAAHSCAKREPTNAFGCTRWRTCSMSPTGSHGSTKRTTMPRPRNPMIVAYNRGSGGDKTRTVSPAVQSFGRSERLGSGREHTDITERSAAIIQRTHSWRGCSVANMAKHSFRAVHTVLILPSRLRPVGRGARSARILRIRLSLAHSYPYVRKAEHA